MHFNTPSANVQHTSTSAWRGEFVSNFKMSYQNNFKLDERVLNITYPKNPIPPKPKERSLIVNVGFWVKFARRSPPSGDHIEEVKRVDLICQVWLESRVGSGAPWETSGTERWPCGGPSHSLHQIALNIPNRSLKFVIIRFYVIPCSFVNTHVPRLIDKNIRCLLLIKAENSLHAPASDRHFL